MSDADEKLRALAETPKAKRDRYIEELKREIAGVQRERDQLRQQVGAWIDDAPAGSAGLDLLRQIITPAPKGTTE